MTASRGQVVPLVAVTLTVLFGTAALAVDVGYWRYQQRLEQTAADSAALAGANEINFPSANDVQNAAKADAASNGFTDGAGNTSVVVNWPPQSGPNTNNMKAVEVVVSAVQPRFFAAIFGALGQNVSARAVAILSPLQSPCITVLKGDITGDLTLNGGGRGGITTSPLCGIAVNGGLDVTGQANVDASYITYTESGPKGGTYPEGQPVQSIEVTDPCQRLAGCAYLTALPTTQPQLFTAPCLDEPRLPAGALPPGHYCTAISSNVTLQPGLFIFDQGPPTGTLAGTGVTIYNNCTGSNCNTTLNGGNVNDSIVAPLTGPTAGMVYYQPVSLQNSITVNGAAGTVQEMGGVYAPNASFTFNGQLPTLSFLVAGTIRMNGGGLDAGSSLLGMPQPTAAVLAE